MAGSAVKDRVVYPLQKRVINPIVMLAHNLGFPPPGDALRMKPRAGPCEGVSSKILATSDIVANPDAVLLGIRPSHSLPARTQPMHGATTGLARSARNVQSGSLWAPCQG